MTGVGLLQGPVGRPGSLEKTSARRLAHPQWQIDPCKGALGTDLPGQRGLRVTATNADLVDLFARSSGSQSQPGSACVARFDPAVPRYEPVMGRSRLVQRAYEGSYPRRPWVDRWVHGV